MKRALILITLAAGCVALAGVFIGRTMHLGYGHAVYCALGTAATVGCDKVPADGAARLASAAVICVCIPLFATAYGSIVSAHLRRHMALHRVATVRQVRDELDAVRLHLADAVQMSEKTLHASLARHAQNLMDRADVQHEALKAHVSVTVAEAVAPPVPPDAAPKRTRKSSDAPPPGA